MQPFSYTLAADTQSASRLALEDPRSRYLAGGTTLVDLMKLDVEQPTQLIDIGRLPLADVALFPDGSLHIGATVRNSDLAHNETVRSRFPMLSQAVLAGASGQVRNMATAAGNLLQRTRCSYFRDRATPCNKRDPGSGCSAIGGYNRMHAVLGTSESCIATHPSDMAVALVALDARVHILSPGGERVISLAELYRLPGDHPERETTLAPGDLVTAVEVPPLSFATRSLYLKVRDRASFAFALTSSAVALDVADKTVRDARVALGGVGTIPWRSREAEQVLRGKPATLATYRAAADAALAAAVPRRHNAFKIELARRTLVRALLRLETR